VFFRGASTRHLPGPGAYGFLLILLLFVYVPCCLFLNQSFPLKLLPRPSLLGTLLTLTFSSTRNRSRRVLETPLTTRTIA
jgi:hypothetical protein